MPAKTINAGRSRLGLGSRVSVKASYFSEKWARSTFPQSYATTRVYGNIAESKTRHHFIVKFDIFEELSGEVAVTHLKRHEAGEGKELPDDYAYNSGEDESSSDEESGTGDSSDSEDMGEEGGDSEGSESEEMIHTVGGVDWEFAGSGHELEHEQLLKVGIWITSPIHQGSLKETVLN